MIFTRVGLWAPDGLGTGPQAFAYYLDCTTESANVVNTNSLD